MKSKLRRGQFSDEALKIIARIKKRGGDEENLGIPGWRCFQFDTNVDQRRWYVKADGEVRAGESFRTARKVKV